MATRYEVGRRALPRAVQEVATLGLKAVTIRDSLEPAEALDAGVLTLCGLNTNDAKAKLLSGVKARPVRYAAGEPKNWPDDSERSIKNLCIRKARMTSDSGKAQATPHR